MSEESKVLSIERKRFNKRTFQWEWKVVWEGGSITWEPKDSFMDEDGTFTSCFLRFEQIEENSLCEEDSSETSEVSLCEEDPSETSTVLAVANADEHVLEQKAFPNGYKCKTCNEFTLQTAVRLIYSCPLVSN